ncbi:MAG: alpha-glucan family phosphorylase [Phycisphaerales bacterium JB039]
MPPSSIAYFSMEIALEPSVPTYAGGLGVLAGDHLRAAADAGLPLVGVTLLHAGGHFRQRLSARGEQIEEPVTWDVREYLTPLDTRAMIRIEGRPVEIGAWKYHLPGAGGESTAAILLDTNLPENAEQDRRITDRLYLGDERHRLKQEAVLGIGGVRMLEALGYRDITTYHMNEGHAALLTLELLRREAQRQGRPPTETAVVEAVRRRCVFTTHTPVAAGHDKFPLNLVTATLEPELIDPYRGQDAVPLVAPERMLNMTFLGFNLSKYLNGVAVRHRQVSRAMFEGYSIESITNGVHAATWVAPKLAEALDRHIPGWREDNLSLRYAASIPLEEMRAAHLAAKRDLCATVKELTGVVLDPQRFTMGFGRRATAYKRADLLLTDPDRLRAMAAAHGPLQVVCAGKAHPYDRPGVELIRRLIQGLKKLAPDVVGVYLPNFDMALAKRMVSGVDLWLNTPLPPLEASGTSGMKAAINGVPSLSTLDGWWLEGCVEHVTGWAIGDDTYASGRIDQSAEAVEARRLSDAAAMYDKLEKTILPLYHNRPERWQQVMRQAIALNGSFFNAQRMLTQYIAKAYFA